MFYLYVTIHRHTHTQSNKETLVARSITLASLVYYKREFIHDTGAT